MYDRPVVRSLVGIMPSITEKLARTYTVRWLRLARSQPSGWNDRVRCFEALSVILTAHRASRSIGCWGQPHVSPARLLSEVARGARFSTEAVYQRWRAEQSDHGIKRWAGPDPVVKPREAFIAEARIVSFWPYRQGALVVADEFDMSLTEVAASYLRALAAWASDNPVLAACVPAGPPPSVAEDMMLLTQHGLRHRPGSRPDLVSGARRLETLACVMVAAVLDDASITPLGAFNVIREETLLLLSDPPDPAAVRVSSAVSELADLLLHSREGVQVLRAGQARQLAAELAGLSEVLARAVGKRGDEHDEQPGAKEDP